ncbi:hypothetical protein SAMN05216567_106426 [Variovorax sp. OK605]|uniref:hypothetical protein n=1 Tax=Variovorax sp. OK605 TaxID=1855317 RepID=UPI0008E6E620|nr:hypothetical protein [Variovorax sp. OK605]SFP50372.1 hypothetical protein SAMN05216567_106426 [Variovorax sp. OK605]
MYPDHLILYHGTTAGWLNLTGFKKPDFAYGENTDCSAFVYLCSERPGAESAANTAHRKVRLRHEGKWNHDKELGLRSLKQHFVKKEIRYEFDRYVYEVKCPSSMRILDLHEENLNASDLALVKNAIVLQKFGPMGLQELKRWRLALSVFLERRSVSRRLKSTPKVWVDLLYIATANCGNFSSPRLIDLALACYKAFGPIGQIKPQDAIRGATARGKIIAGLTTVGFELFRNVERDGDNQGYGEVWALPWSKGHLVTIKPPSIFEVFR